jgi:hypothetical protein
LREPLLLFPFPELLLSKFEFELTQLCGASISAGIGFPVPVK